MLRKKIYTSRLIRKLTVFVLCFFVFSILIVIYAYSPEPGMARMVMKHNPSIVSVAHSPVPAALTDSDLSRQLHELGYREPAIVTKSKGSYKNSEFSYMDLPLEQELQRYTYDRCEQLGLEYEMVLAIMWRESRFQLYAVGTNKNGTRDSGLMQINDVNKDWLFERHGIDDLLDPYQNIDAGTAILAQYFAKYGENFALMAYQYGEQGMLNNARQGMETNALTIKVQEKRDEYKRQRLGA